MNWKRIGKHAFFAPLYAAVITTFAFMLYILYGMTIAFAFWLSSNWLINIPIAIFSVWAFAIVAAIMYKAGLFDA